MKPRLFSTTVAALLMVGVVDSFADPQEVVVKASQEAPASAPTTPEPPQPVATKPAQATPPAAKPGLTGIKVGPGKAGKAAKPPKPPKPPKPAWEQFKLNSKTTMFLDFTDANVDMIISMFARTSGITILKDPAFKNPLTVTSAKSVGLKEAFEIFNTVLNMNQYELQKKGNLMIVGKIPPPAAPAPTPPPMMATPPPPQEEKIVLKVYRLQYASSSSVARVVNEVFSQQSLEAMIQQLQQGGGFQGGGNPFGGRGPQPPKVVRASSDDYSNAVVVNAPEKFQKDVETLISQLDKTSETPLESTVFRLKYVSVDEAVDAIQGVLEANAPTGRGAGRAPAQDNNPFFFNPFRQQTSRKSGQTAIAIKATNSVIVSATKENMAIVKDLVNNLDQQSDFVGTTFVVPLLNAKASDVATLLNAAFTKRRDQNQFENPFFYIYSDGFGDNKKTDVTTDVTEDGRLVNVRDLTGKVNVTADPNTNSLIVVTLPSNLKLIRGIIDKIDKVGDQVMIETVIVEANLDKTTKMGIEWSFLQGKVLGNNRVSATGSTDFTLQTSKDPLQGLKYTLTGPDYRAFVNALQTDTRFKVLSTPRIFTSNNVKAEINVAQQVPYITRQESSNSTSGVISNYDFKNIGIVLTVTPRITSAGEVSMEVTQSADDLQGFTSFDAPIVNHRQAQTTATVRDGETIVLGGIIRSTTNVTENKIPILGDLPLIGNLFRSNSRTNGQTELMVLLTPHIVRNNKDAQLLREAETNRLSSASQEAIKKLIPPKIEKGSGGS